MLSFSELLQEIIISYVGLHDSKKETTYSFIEGLFLPTARGPGALSQRFMTLADGKSKSVSVLSEDRHLNLSGFDFFLFKIIQ